MENTLAVDIGGNNSSIDIFEGTSLRGKLSHPTDRSAGPRWMLIQMENVLKALWHDAFIHGCGIGLGGPVDFVARKAIASTHVDGWEGFDLVKRGSRTIRHAGGD